MTILILTALACFGLGVWAGANLWKYREPKGK